MCCCGAWWSGCAHWAVSRQTGVCGGRYTTTRIRATQKRGRVRVVSRDGARGERARLDRVAQLPLRLVPCRSNSPRYVSGSVMIHYSRITIYKAAGDCGHDTDDRFRPLALPPGSAHRAQRPETYSATRTYRGGAPRPAAGNAALNKTTHGSDHIQCPSTHILRPHIFIASCASSFSELAAQLAGGGARRRGTILSTASLSSMILLAEVTTSNAPVHILRVHRFIASFSELAAHVAGGSARCGGTILSTSSLSPMILSGRTNPPIFSAHAK